MKRLLFLLVLIANGVFAQDTVLTELNGIQISYKLTKLSESDKKDNYLIVVTATNTNAYDSFYQAPKGGVNHFFITVTVRNVNKEVSMAANESRLLTSDGKALLLKAIRFCISGKEI
ncbi:MAG: hypothetical protein EOO87_02115 [Pedobacter sp.]|nr:MAG: hypothetical protein EOO87_02115 [Pedobacter sp.]